MKLRQKIILKQLMETSPMEIDSFTSFLQVTSRTIRNDIDELNDTLKECVKGSALTVKMNSVFLNCGDEGKKQLESVLNASDYYLYRLNSDERKTLITIELLLRNNEVRIDDLAEMFYVSRTTILNDINHIRESLAKYNIELEGKKGTGILAVCDEVTRRNTLRVLISSSVLDFEKDASIPPALKRVFKEIDIRKIKEILVECERRFDYQMTDISFEGLVIHIALSIKRNQSEGEKTSDDFENSFENLQLDAENAMAEEILNRLNGELSLSLPVSEKNYIAMHIYNKNSQIKSNVESHDWLYVQLLTTELINRIQSIYSTDFEYDKALYEGLNTHILSSLIRVKNRQILENPLKEELKRNYRFLYESIQEHIGKINEFLGEELSEDEISYILIHFAAAIERTIRNKARQIPNVLIVCSTGLATARLMLSKLEKHFKLNVVEIISAHRIHDLLQEREVDLVISTVRLNLDFPNIVISPLVKEEDITLVKNRLAQLGFSSNSENHIQETRNDVDEWLQVIGKYADIRDERQLKNELESRMLGVQEMNKRRSDKGEVQFMLSEILQKQNILLHQTAEDWEDAVRKSGEILVRQSAIEPAYIESAIRNVRELGPYIVITKGVAIPHAPTEDGVHRTAISLLTLDHGVNFGNNQNDPVKYIFMISTTSPTSHLKALADLVDILSIKEFYGLMDNALMPEQVFKYILEFENNKEKGGNQYE